MPKVKRRKLTKITDTELPYIGDLTAPVLMVLDPVVGNLGATKPLNKNQLEWFADRITEHGGFKKKDVCLISCSMPVDGETWQRAKLLNAQLKEHKEKLLRIIEVNKPKMVLPFGAKACQQLIGRAVQITKARGQLSQNPDIANGAPVMPLYSPFYAQRQPENEAVFKTDLQTAGRVYKAGFDVEAATLEYKHDYQWCYDLDFLIKMKPKRLSIDAETLGLDAFREETKLLTVQLTWEPGKSVVIPVDYDRGSLRHHNFIPWDTIKRAKLLKQLRTLLTDPSIEKLGQNFKFDWLMFYYKLGVKTANYADDTQLLAHLIDENQMKLNIDDLVKQHVPEMAGYNDSLNNDPDHHGKTRMDLFPPDKMLPYAGGDTDAAFRLCDKLKSILQKDDGLVACYNRVTMPAQRAFCEIELNGFPVSQRELSSFENYLRLHQKRERIYLLKQIPKSIKNKWRDSGVGVKVTRADLLRDWLYNHEDGLQLEPKAYTKTSTEENKIPSISSKQALPYYVADYPIIERLIDYIKNDKLLHTYAAGMHKYIVDGLIRPTYKLAATVTGRTASASPNGQNWPKRGKLAKKFRKMFKAPKGWVYLSLDLSQAELRIAAMLSGDRNMLKVYADGGDIHRTTAAGTMGLTVEEFLQLPKEEQDLKRFQAKAINFGFLYGMWWVKFRQYAKTEYGIDFTEAEAKHIREQFFKTYPMLEHWHETSQDIVFSQGQIRTLDGRIRHLPGVYSPEESVRKQAARQGINAPVQALGSDIGLMALGRLIPYLSEHGYDEWLKPCGFIHDAIVCLVREDMVAKAINIVKNMMESNPYEEWFGWTPQIPIIADAEVGRTLAQTYELSPDRFQGKNKNNTYEEILEFEVSVLKEKLDKETNAKNKEKLQQAILALQLDINETVFFGSKTRSGRRIITKKRSVIHAKRKATKPVKSGNRQIRKTIRRST